MRQVIVFLFVVIGLISCKSTDKKGNENDITKNQPGIESNDLNKTVDTTNYTSIQWPDSTFLDLGNQKEGKEIEIRFRFKNTGSKNLVIETVTAQCGCTIPEKPERPFTPGEEGFITAKYNGSGHDETRKQVYVKANITPDGADTLTFRAFLVK